MPAELDGPILFVLLDQYAPLFLTIIVLCGLVGASMSTANGAILAISNVSVRNLGGVRRVHVPGQRDPLLRATRIAMVPMTLIAILIAIYVKQTGILLTLAFDLLLACLVVPFILGLVWRKGWGDGGAGVDRRRPDGAPGAVRHDADDVRPRQHDPLHPQRGVRRVVRRLADVHRLRRLVDHLRRGRAGHACRRRSGGWTSGWPRTSTTRWRRPTRRAGAGQRCGEPPPAMAP